MSHHSRTTRELLLSTQEYLNNCWAEYKGQRQRDYEERNARRAASAERQREWRARMTEKLQRLRNVRSILEEKLDRAQQNLSSNRDKLEEAWSDTYRERVREWIDQDEERISKFTNDLEEIEEKIESIKQALS